MLHGPASHHDLGTWFFLNFRLIAMLFLSDLPQWKQGAWSSAELFMPLGVQISWLSWRFLTISMRFTAGEMGMSEP